MINWQNFFTVLLAILAAEVIITGCRALAGRKPGNATG